jgi:hypothetical protein
MKNSPCLEVAACSNLIIERAQKKAEEYEVPKACTTEELLADPEIEIVVNLTVPIAHASVAQAAVEAGKSDRPASPKVNSTAEASRCRQTKRQEPVQTGLLPCFMKRSVKSNAAGRFSLDARRPRQHNTPTPVAGPPKGVVMAETRNEVLGAFLLLPPTIA